MPVPVKPAEPSEASQTAASPAAAPVGGLAGAAERAGAITAESAPAAGRILLGVVFLWFGYHELVQPGGWTPYVPVVAESSSLAVILVLLHRLGAAGRSAAPRWSPASFAAGGPRRSPAC